MKKTDNILNSVLEKIEPPKEEIELIENSLKDFLERVKNNLSKTKIDADIFVGGSFAKKTVIKKDYYDVDVFLRFDKKYKNENISVLAKKILGNFKNVSIIHGSRDYFRIKFSPDFFIELIPVIKVSSTRDYENITDLSYFHVKYINRKIKSEKILDEIRIAKAFCHANKCYGAESYIKGFSGYSLELLIYYYGSFLKFVKAVAKMKDREVIDMEKLYKKKNEILLDMNSSKLESPIILVDPTYKGRNALAALSSETFERFKDVCKKFIKNPSIKFFEIEKTDLGKIKKEALKKKQEFILLEVQTDKQEGDVAGSKLLKFYNHLNSEIERYFNVKKKGFNYNNKKSARYFFVAERKKEIVFDGPYLEDKKNVSKFKKEHARTFIDKKKICAKEKVDFNLKEFIRKWKIKNKKRIKEMYIERVEVIDNI